MNPALVFASPRKLPDPRQLAGRVVVLDIAFAADNVGRGFDKTTGKFIRDLGPRLARWVDHHDHPAHVRFAGDERFVLCTKAEHGACPEMIDPELVRRTGPIETIVTHFDVDGIYSAAKWILDGREPYPGADDDARAADTRIGEMGEEAKRIDWALRAHYRDPVLKQRIVHYLVGGMRPGLERDAIEAGAVAYQQLLVTTRALAQDFKVEGEIAIVRVPGGVVEFDKTELLLLGQTLAKVAVVVDAGNVSIAADFNSGLDFVTLLDLGGGMPTRVSVPEKRLHDALTRIRARLEPSS